jgi:hypothetical protein
MRSSIASSVSDRSRSNVHPMIDSQTGSIRAYSKSERSGSTRNVGIEERLDGRTDYTVKPGSNS